jgi:two-component system sensor histidine kinase PilS (NtrC family)
VLVFLEDVGRIKERAQQLKLASLGRLTASIAHEIRNPLSAIGHAGELLREERRVEMKERLLRILNDNVIRLDRIVSDILELGRQSRAQPELLRVDEFCAGFVEHFMANEDLQAGVIVLEVQALSLCFDRSHLHQVLWNLVSNAFRHSSRGPGAVRIQMEGGSNDGRVELHIIDDGPGIPDTVREQIFEPFLLPILREPVLDCLLPGSCVQPTVPALNWRLRRQGRISLLQGETTRVCCQN